MTSPLVPENILAGARGAAGQTYFCVLEDWKLYENVRRWALLARLTIPTTNQQIIPSSTSWYVTVEPDYPLGAIKLYPAKEGGISLTFQHQSFNAPGDPALPWRTGDLCLTTPFKSLGRTGLDHEPTDTYHRLAWHINRAYHWLVAASAGDLVQPGEPFELPQLPGLSRQKVQIAIYENGETFRLWEACSSQSGWVTIGTVPRNPFQLFASAFQTRQRSSIVAPRWGKHLSGADQSGLGVWILLERCPVIAPWRAPETWGELRFALSEQGIDFDTILRSLAGPLRDRKAHILLLGFPVPENVAEEAAQISWLSVQLPILSNGVTTLKGFRSNELGYWLRDRNQLMSSNSSVDWIRTDNWAPHEISARGALPELIRTKSIVIIGGGAIGSALSELFVRGGATDIRIIDWDVVEAGNLVRHTLLLQDVGLSKADRLSDRLNRSSPHANSVAVNADITHENDDLLRTMEEADLIVDCTGSDDVLAALETRKLQSRSWLISVSLSLYGHRLYCFSSHVNRFPLSIFQRLLEPWLRKDKEDYPDINLPREGIGCWHPLFPARADDIWLMAATACKHIVATIEANEAAPQLAVYEQVTDEAGFLGLRRVMAVHNE